LSEAALRAVAQLRAIDRRCARERRGKIIAADFQQAIHSRQFRDKPDF
jgi:hypothetical protein